MIQLNSSSNLWRPTDATGNTTADPPGLEAAHGLDQSMGDVGLPVCCWNICTGIIAPEGAPQRVRHKASGG